MLRPCLLAALVAASGAPAGAQVLVERLTGTPFGQFGAALAVPGDLDGDGLPELAVGEPVFHLSSASGEGRVVVYRGADFTPLHEFIGAAHDALGSSVAAAGDVDGDGVGDLVAGGPSHLSDEFLYEGTATVFSGRTGAVVWSLTGSADFEFLGESVASAGDLTGDGQAEVLVGGQLDALHVVRPDGSILWTLTGDLLFGYRVHGLGDVDGDGVPDFLASESWFDAAPDQPRRGRVHVLSGASGQLLYAVVGDADYDYLGRALAAPGDLDGDGVPEWVAASYVSLQGGNQAGLARVLRGTDGATLKAFVGTADSQWLGFAVTGCGDVDLDGVPDLALGLPGVPGTFSNGLGQVRLVSGADFSILHDILGQSAPGASNVALGFALAGADFDADGIGDLAAGDVLYESATLGGPVGAAEVFLGCPAQVAAYGDGWPGTLGVPALSASTPALGATVTLQVGNSLGTTTPALLLVGVQASAPLPSGATLLVQPLVLVPLALPAAGASLASALPADPVLVFAQVALQVVELDAGAVGGKSLSAGVKLTLGFDL